MQLAEITAPRSRSQSGICILQRIPFDSTANIMGINRSKLSPDVIPPPILPRAYSSGGGWVVCDAETTHPESKSRFLRPGGLTDERHLGERVPGGVRDASAE